MDVLKPKMVSVDGRNYRFSDSSAWPENQNLGSYKEEKYEPVSNSDEDFDDIEIIPYYGNRYKHSFHVPSAFFSFIIGGKGATKKRLEAETKTRLQIPKIGEAGDVVIIGHDHRSIVSARNRINLLVETSRKKIPFTHFLSIPLVNESVIRGYNDFKDDVLKKTAVEARGVNESIFLHQEKLHLTLDMLKLLDEEERKQAAERLYACKADVIDPFFEENDAINLEIRGVECMNDDPSEVKVLYAKIIDSNNSLQPLVEQIVKYFAEAGLISRTYNRVKLHMTIMNSKFALEGDENALRGDWGSFDASNILKVHKDTYFGEIKLSTIHLSQRHSKNETGYYKETAKINF